MSTLTRPIPKVRPVYPDSDGKLFMDIPAKRAGTMEELGGVVAFLASQLGGYMTGHWFAVDGGRHAFTF